jgi:hypothetical protein
VFGVSPRRHDLLLNLPQSVHDSQSAVVNCREPVKGGTAFCKQARFFLHEIAPFGVYALVFFLQCADYLLLVGLLKGGLLRSLKLGFVGCFWQGMID